MEVLFNHHSDGIDEIPIPISREWKTSEEYAVATIRSAFSHEELIGENGTYISFTRGEHYNDGSAYYETARYDRTGINRIMVGKDAEPIERRTYGNRRYEDEKRNM